MLVPYLRWLGLVPALVAVPMLATADVERQKYAAVVASFVDPDQARFTAREGLGFDVLFGLETAWRNVFLEFRGSGEVHETSPDGASDNYRGAVSAELQYVFGRRGLFSAFVLGGGGVAYNENRVDEFDEAVAFANVGAGLLSRKLTSANIRLRFEGRARYESYGPGMDDFRLGVGIEIPLDNAEIVVREVQVPVAAPAPRAPPKSENYPPRPVDKDQDGVLDNFDACPGTPAGAIVDASGCVIQVQQPDLSLRGVEFAPNSDQLTAAAQKVLEEVATALVRLEGRVVTIAGHTDSQGPAEANLVLSLARANAVKRFLTQRGVAASRLKVAGFGESQPVASNDTVAGRAQNRRVELRIDAPFDPK